MDNAEEVTRKINYSPKLHRYRIGKICESLPYIGSICKLSWLTHTPADVKIKYKIIFIK